LFRYSKYLKVASSPQLNISSITLPRWALT
jgi:hypothetical protein